MIIELIATVCIAGAAPYEARRCWDDVIPTAFHNEHVCQLFAQQVLAEHFQKKGVVIDRYKCITKHKPERDA